MMTASPLRRATFPQQHYGGSCGAALQQDLTISAEDLKAAGVVLTAVEQTVENLIGKKGIEPEVRARALIIREVLAEPAWYHAVGKNDDGGITLFHRLPGRLLKRMANHRNVAFISATLTVSNSFNDFKRSMGIENFSRLSGVVEPTNHGHILVETPLDLGPAEVIASAPKPCLVATTSHEGSSELGALLPMAVVRRRDETTSQAALRIPADGVLIAAGAWAGLDTPIRWASIVVPRIPFDRPTVLDEQVESRYIDSKNVAVRRMRQVVGRGIRTPDAHCTIYILDERYKRLGQFLPERFKESWIEGGRDIERLITAERRRSLAIRPKALAHYGCKCYACDLVPPHRSIIEIHHLRPIAEGIRQTVLEDVIPLCANCHRLAHTQQPPLPIDDLRKKNMSGLAARA